MSHCAVTLSLADQLGRARPRPPPSPPTRQLLIPFFFFQDAATQHYVRPRGAAWCLDTRGAAAPCSSEVRVGRSPTHEPQTRPCGRPRPRGLALAHACAVRPPRLGGAVPRDPLGGLLNPSVCAHVSAPRRDRPRRLLKTFQTPSQPSPLRLVSLAPLTRSFFQSISHQSR